MYIHRIILVALLFASFSCTGTVQEELENVVKHYFSRELTPGMSVGVFQNGKIIYKAGMGYADIENQVPADSATVYRIGSITKQFTAAAILKLAQDGKLALDDHIKKYVHDAPAKWKNITIRNLLNHTSGIVSYTSLPGFWEKYQFGLTHKDLLQLVENEDLKFAPGAKWEYSNSGYYLLGMVVENITGKTYEDYLNETFFQPLSLNSTWYCDYKKIIQHRAAGYDKNDSGWSNSEPISMRPPFAAGALCSSIEDLLRWSQYLSEGKIISPDYYKDMTTSVRLSSGETFSYGLGLSLDELDGEKRNHHGGGINGFSGHISYYPEYNLHIAVLTNHMGSMSQELENGLARVIFEKHN